MSLVKKQGILVSVLGALMMFAVALPAQASTATPDKIAGNATIKVIQLMKDNRAHYEKDPEAFYRDVEQVITPVVAFDEIARAVMGKYAHRVSDKEVDQFTQVFESTLVHFYSRAVLTFDASQLSVSNVEPVPEELMKRYDAGRSRNVPVNLKVRSRDTEYTMSYSMMKQNGEWKVRNIVVEGINIGIQFRNQFENAVNRFRDVSKAIEKWPELMQQSEQEQVKELTDKNQGE
ncbi:MlaC/ttg2D family ABC transporter substrate-binding protein [Sansalvadorimonas verongulae]|uniref:MlaC/ttg2D family ABC transporter substrate-binding protein n=1 Tax=Sansalvadorimonas verongulae TaxID=2172824 RepID=UPI0012BB6F1D|nr:ABC transporter substrate-binding protein [Sansalvadorimonas verongulae]MTI14848.1 ABC transporter substrate-binding protein [Sansalvadorimonas verongulae]